MASQDGFINRAPMEAKKMYYGVQGRLNSSRMGRAAQRGFMESFGWSYSNGVSQGFLGMSDTPLGKAFATGRSRRGTLGGISAAARSTAHHARQAGFKGSMKAVGGAAWKGMGGIFTAYSVIQGYREGGITGAIRDGGISIGINVGANMAIEAAGIAATPLAIAAAGAAIGYGAYRFGEAARSHGKRLRNVEMGAAVVDTFGTMATTRQRSLMALQNSHVNGRMALGNEASLMHTPYLR